MIGKALSVPALADIRTAADALAPYIIQSPLLQLKPVGGANVVFLKLENLQPIGAFKIRPMGNVLLNTDPESLQNGVYTASSGNAGLGLAWMAKELELTATIYAPDSAPADKLTAIRKLGANIQLLTDREWWQIIVDSGHPSDPGKYVDAVRDVAAMAGSGTIGLEIVEQLPGVETVIIPFGGGGLSCGIAAAIRPLKPQIRIIVAESDAAAPVTAALQAGKPVTVEMKPSFISGAGASTVLADMWPLVSEFVDDTVVVPVSAVADAISLLYVRNKIVAEGAGTIALAAALTTEHEFGKTVCIVSGGNIDPDVMASILLGQES